MKTASTSSAFILGVLLASASAYGRPSQQNNPDTHHNSATQNIKDAGHHSKEAAKDAGHGVKQGTEHAYHSSKREAKGVTKTSNTAKGAINGGKAGAKQPANPPQ